MIEANKKNFEVPTVEIAMFAVEDIITTSGEDWGMGEV